MDKQNAGRFKQNVMPVIPPAGCHRLPQIATMGKNSRMAQSKTSAKQQAEAKQLQTEGTLLHVEETSSIVNVLTESNEISQLLEDFEKLENATESNDKSTEKDIALKQENNQDISATQEEKNSSLVSGVKNRQRKKSFKAKDSSFIDYEILDNETEKKKKKMKNKKASPNKSKTSVFSESPEKDKVAMKEHFSTISGKGVTNIESKEESFKIKGRKRKSKSIVDDEPARGNKEESVKSKGKKRKSKSIGEDEPARVETDPQSVADSLVPGDAVESVPSALTEAPRCVLIQPSEVPTAEQIEKMLATSSVMLDHTQPPAYVEGDMLWGKVSGHPYWPCMVSSCPFTKMTTRMKGDARMYRLYHVQFFGDEVERGWVGAASFLPFDGKEKFLARSQMESQKPHKPGKNKNPYKVTSHREQAWNIAVEEAEKAMILPLEERKMRYLFHYIFVDKQAKQKDTGVSSSDASLGDSPKSKNRKRKRDSVEPGSSKKAKRLKVDKSDSSSVKVKNDDDNGKNLATDSLPSPKPDLKSRTPETGVKKRGRLPKLKQEESLDVVKEPTVPVEIATGDDKIEKEAPETPTAQSLTKRGRPKKAPDFYSDTEMSRPNTPALSKEEGTKTDNQNMAAESKTKAASEPTPYELEIFKLYSTSKIERDNVCAICEKNGDAIQCNGSCGQHFHASCLELDEGRHDGFKCSECTSGIHSCFSCKSTDGLTKKCAVPMCGRFYHEHCVQTHRLTRFESKGFTCPLHTCATCAVDNVRNPKASKGRLYRCVRCPTSYHVGDMCIAAGSFVLAGANILCSKHFQPNKSLSLHSRLNVPWCFSCSKGGTLLCCESCPASFHAECVKIDKTPEGAWYCLDCTDGKQPLYGNIVWIKVGIYRWWPGEICHPEHVPRNIQEKAHQVGEFPCRFFGSHDYYWIHKGRVFLFQEGDKGSKDKSSRGLFKIYSKGVKEATEAYKAWTAHKLKKEEQEQERSEKKPAPFKAVKCNVPIGNVQIYKAELSELPRCECNPDQEKPCESDCLNRMMMYECHPAVCPAGERCENQRFQKRLYPECAPVKCNGRGWGLQCKQDIKKGQFVYEYVGDLIDEEECKKRIEQSHEDNITNFYMLTMDKNRIIDAGPKGNFSRFMNHSCCPNLETQKWMVNGDIRVGLFAMHDIPKGSEITFNYNLECIGNEKKACSCGAENCSGFLGVRPKSAAAAAYEKRVKEPKKKKRKKKSESRKDHDDSCFRCGEGGELVMCDKGSCPKVYHLQCLKLSKPPSGKWLCPWHHCDDCGKYATSKCSECPNSFCGNHIEGNIFKVDNKLICDEHPELLDALSMSVVSSLSMDEQSSAESAMEVDEPHTQVSGLHAQSTKAKASRIVPRDLQSNLEVLKDGDTLSKGNDGQLKTAASTVGKKAKHGKKKSDQCIEIKSHHESMEVTLEQPEPPVVNGESLNPVTNSPIPSQNHGSATRKKTEGKSRKARNKARSNGPKCLIDVSHNSDDNESESDLVIALPV